jgi:hypothetical protein
MAVVGRRVVISSLVHEDTASHVWVTELPVP